MDTPPVESESLGHGKDDQGCSAQKRREMIAVAAYYNAERRGFQGGEQLSDWLQAEAEVERLLGPDPLQDSKTGAKHLFQEKLEAQLKEWDARLEELKSKARDAEAKIRAEMASQLEALAGKRALAQQKLQELRLHGESTWEDLKDGAEGTWNDLWEAIRHSTSLFK